MQLLNSVLRKLHHGYAMAAELASNNLKTRSYVFVWPQYPSKRENPEAWVQIANFQPRIKDPSYISGFKVRLLVHDVKYSNPDWGWDYDIVLNDPSTRVRSVFVAEEDSIGPAIEAWGAHVEDLKETHLCDSSLTSIPANKLIDQYLKNPLEHSHLWTTDEDDDPAHWNEQNEIKRDF